MDLVIEEIFKVRVPFAGNVFLMPAGRNFGEKGNDLRGLQLLVDHYSKTTIGPQHRLLSRFQNNFLFRLQAFYQLVQLAHMSSL